MMSANEISRLLAQRAEEVARYLLPNGKKIGNEYCVGSIEVENGQSLKVHLQGEKAGVWCDFAIAGDASGDLLDLWALKRNISLSAALKEAAHYLGIFQPKVLSGGVSVDFIRPTQKWDSTIKETSNALAYLLYERKLTPESIRAYRVNESGRNLVFPYYREDGLIFVKYLSLDRPNGKKEIRAEKGCEPCLFGWQAIPSSSRTITICEGEIDAISLHVYGFSALSVPFGGGAGNKHKWVEYEFDRLAVFNEIYLCFDNDAEGAAAVAELIGRLGRHRCRIVRLPKKDANECLQMGVSQAEIQQCFAAASTLDPEELKSAELFVEQVIAEFYPTDEAALGYGLPWEKTKGKILLRPEELSVWTGINGHGKSQVMGQIMLQAMTEGARVCVASLELAPRRLLARLTRQAGAIANPTKEFIRAIHRWYGDKLWLFDLVGTAKSERLLEVFTYARQRYDIDVFLIDSLLKLDIAEDDFTAQKALVERLCDFKSQHKCQIHLIAHPRKGIDESKIPGKLDIKGTGAISDLADNCFAVWRNKKKEVLKQIQSSGGSLAPDQLKILDEWDCLLACDKQRNADWEGKLGLNFDSVTLQYLNHNSQMPIVYVQR